jgi:hypothetical protein
MNALPWLAAAVILGGCGHSDPIEGLMLRLKEEAKAISLTTYPYRPVDLPTNASPQEVIVALSKRGDFRAEYVAEYVGVAKIREVQIPADVQFHRHPTAVLVDTGAAIPISTWNTRESVPSAATPCPSATCKPRADAGETLLHI